MSFFKTRRVLATVACSTVGLIGVGTESAKAEPLCTPDIRAGGGQIMPGQDWGQYYVGQQCMTTSLSTACHTSGFYPLPITPSTTPPGFTARVCHPIP